MTLAQLGLPETFTPARLRFPTRMFPAEKKGEYEPYRICERHQEVKVSNGIEAPKDVTVHRREVYEAIQNQAKSLDHGPAPVSPDNGLS